MMKKVLENVFFFVEKELFVTICNCFNGFNGSFPLLKKRRQRNCFGSLENRTK